MRNNDTTKILVSSKLMYIRIEDAEIKQANNFKIENDTLSFLKDDDVINQIFFSISTSPIYGIIDDFQKWHQLAHVMKSVSERPVVIYIYKKYENDFDFNISINI